MNRQEIKKKLLSMIKDNKDFVDTKTYNNYIELYNKQDPLLKTGPKYYYFPEEDIAIKSSTLYDFIDSIIDDFLKEMKEELFNG